MTKQISNLAKFYFYDQNKYGGKDLYDFLDQKVVIFHDYWEKGHAADYYYEKIVGNASSIKKMIEMIKLHFETGEITQALLKVWRETTLHKIITDNLDKNRLGYLELLLHYFRKIKQGLGRRGRGREGRAYGSDFQQRQKKCYHPREERLMAYSRFCTQYTHSSEPNLANFQGLLANYEGIQGIEDLVEDKDKDVDEAQYILDNMHIEDEFQEDDFDTEAYFSDDFGKLNGIQILTDLQDQSVWHSVTKSDPFEEAFIKRFKQVMYSVSMSGTTEGCFKASCQIQGQLVSRP
ncbi:hypothetical protein HI914_03277 [Erysiphe necator]|nr:hypothetical protein HI914_03277 [Erysiphe necator]